jgi:hypothetical protein
MPCGKGISKRRGRRTELEFSFAVLNPGGRDPIRIFAQGAGSPTDPGHPPVNYHGYAACCRGAYFRRHGDIPDSVEGVLVLLRKNGLGDALQAIRSLRKRGKQVLVSWKESGLPQVARALERPRIANRFRAVCAEAHGFVSSTPDLVPLYRSAGCLRGGFVPTPYPVEETAWDFSIPLSERTGIFVGTREFVIPSRNHYLALSSTCGVGHPVTVINTEGWTGARLLRSVSPKLRVVSGKLPYSEYLHLMARHRIVFQLDRSTVPGQVAGDALLSGLPCVGGDGAIDRLVFPELCGRSLTVESAVDEAKRLLEDDEYYTATLTRARELALEKVSFAKVRQQLSAQFSL